MNSLSNCLNKLILHFVDFFSILVCFFALFSRGEQYDFKNKPQKR